MSSISLIQPDRYCSPGRSTGRRFWTGTVFAECPREEMDQLGWDSCDIILVTGDAYVDHPSFGMAICGRMLEARAFASGSSPARLEQQRRFHASG